MGIEPEIGFLEHAGADRYESIGEGLESLRRVVGPADEREAEALERYASEHLVETTDADGRRVWKLEPALNVRWAFLGWDAVQSLGTLAEE
jgi:hypothetical protein